MHVLATALRQPCFFDGLLFGKTDLYKALSAITLNQQQDARPARIARFRNGLCQISRIFDAALTKPANDIAWLNALFHRRAAFCNLGYDNACQSLFKAQLLGKFSVQIIDRKAKVVQRLGIACRLFVNQTHKFGLFQFAKGHLDCAGAPAPEDFHDNLCANIRLGHDTRQIAHAVDLLVVKTQDHIPRPGDVILSFDNKKIDRMRDLPRIVAETDIGTKVVVEIFRGGRPSTVEVTLGELEKAELVGLVDEQPAGDAQTLDHLGFTVDDLDAELAEELGLEETLTGVVVTEVAEGGPAMEKGVEPGDIIRRFGQRRVENAADLAQSVSETRDSGRSGVLLLIERDGRERFVQIGFAEK